MIRERKTIIQYIQTESPKLLKNKVAFEIDNNALLTLDEKEINSSNDILSKEKDKNKDIFNFH